MRIYKHITLQGDMEDMSLPIDLLMREVIPGDALNPDRVVYNSICDKLLAKGLALPQRK